MKLLLNDELAPITRRVGFLQVDHERLALEYRAWKGEGIRANEDHKQSRVLGNLKEVLFNLLPLSFPVTKILFTPTMGDWTACFDNNWKGGQQESLVRYMAKRLQCNGLMLVAIPQTIREKDNKVEGQWGAMGFELYGPQKTDWLNRKRIIGIVNSDGKWKFTADGEPLPFEKPELYQATRMQDRLPEWLFHEYLAALGLSPFDESFYLPSSKSAPILNELQMAPSAVQHYDLKDVKQYI